MSEVVIVQFRKIYINTKVYNEKPGSTFKQPVAKLKRDLSTSGIKSHKRINKQ